MSRYEILQETVEGLEAYRLLDHGRLAEAVVYPELGNNCLVFRTTPDGSEHPTAADVVDVFIPTADLHGLKRLPFTAGNPILFPFPNRVRDGIYAFEGETYRMDGLMAKGWDAGAGQALHGLVGDRPWNVTEAFADEGAAVIHAAIQLDDYPEIYEQYPFRCRLEVRYALRDGVLSMHTSVENRGDKTLPMGYGIHPWFPTRLKPGAQLPADLLTISMEERATATVHVPADAIWELKELMPTGNILPVEGTRYDLRHFNPLQDHFFDDVFTHVRYRADGWSEGGLRDPENHLEMYMAADAGFREWVLYAPLNSPVIALEPYTCPTDAVNLAAQNIDAGLIALPPTETWRGDIRFGLRRY